MPATTTERPPAAGRGGRGGGAWRKLAWFVGLWIAGVAAIAVTSYALRAAMGLG